ncbi:hypothetical protein BLJ79_21475 [Arthrobacter sp. UCD-GKA]|uniref:single-stranded DNA-binding protein n=1 Tax=Arthrobacter sp. UCD-GKA TaxID=1913576 RepID=UPI0008DCA3F8|nr:single-stranded DNA-binding protein [Arthrobacter sp. UCD-GKA]OIH81934.1 hypothetical protein BLJ79_21475 [Arthrobacter sp. UCD-GKA]
MQDAIITGNIGNHPELKFTQNGNAVLSFSVADSKSKKLPDGNWETLATQWFRVSVWGDLGQMLAEKLDKGVRVKIVGEFMSREYDAKDGTKGVSMDVTAWGVQVLTKPSGNNQQQQSGGFGQQQQGGFGGQQQGGGWNTPASNPSGGWGNPGEGPAF